MKKPYFITWNPDKTEGYIATEREDAVTARTGKKRRDRYGAYTASAATAFFDTYGDEKLPRIQKVEL